MTRHRMAATKPAKDLGHTKLCGECGEPHTNVAAMRGKLRELAIEPCKTCAPQLRTLRRKRLEYM